LIARIVLLFVFVCACGGRVDDGDGGTGGPDASTSKDSQSTTDVSLLPDVKPTCKLGMGSGTVSSDGSCTTTQAWACGEIDFSITCNCPEAACTCQGGDPKTILTTYACPSCDVEGNLEKLAALCGYPAP
jgi:hypothetical protein